LYFHSKKHKIILLFMSNNLGMSWFRQGCHRALDAAEW
jgi:uncharacterized protein (DUF2164 family)